MNWSKYDKFYLGCIPRLRSLSIYRHMVLVTNHIAGYCCCDVRGWSVSCRESGIQFQPSEVDGFLFDALRKLCVEVYLFCYRHPTK